MQLFVRGAFKQCGCRPHKLGKGFGSHQAEDPMVNFRHALKRALSSSFEALAWMRSRATGARRRWNYVVISRLHGKGMDNFAQHRISHRGMAACWRAMTLWLKRRCVLIARRILSDHAVPLRKVFASDDPDHVGILTGDAR